MSTKPPESTPSRSRADLRLVIVFIAALAAFSGLYRLNPPAPHYIVETASWSMNPPEDAASISYYGRLLYSLGAAAVAGILAGFLVRPGANAGPSRRMERLLMITVLVILTVAVLSLVTHEWHRWIAPH